MATNLVLQDFMYQPVERYRAIIALIAFFGGFVFLSLSKAFADKFDNTENINFVFQKVENIVGKGENAGFHNDFESLPTQDL